MRLIVVRHGDTKVKVEDYVQPIENPLSEAGILQAKEVAKRLADYKVDRVVSSPLLRARDTATIINETLHKDLVFNELLAEVKWPTVLEGKRLDDPEVAEYRKLRNEHNIAGSTWHYSDEENFIDLKTRARKLLDELENLKGENILAVTHSTFLKVLVTIMCHGDSVPWPVYYDFLHFTRPKHTSIATFNLVQGAKWQLAGWNI